MCLENLTLTGYTKAKEIREGSGPPAWRVVWLDGGTGFGGLAKGETLLWATSGKMLRRAITVHVLKNNINGLTITTNIKDFSLYYYNYYNYLRSLPLLLPDYLKPGYYYYYYAFHPLLLILILSVSLLTVTTNINGLMPYYY